MLDSTLHHFHHQKEWKEERSFGGLVPHKKKGISCPKHPCGKNKQFNGSAVLYCYCAHSLHEGFSTL